MATIQQQKIRIRLKAFDRGSSTPPAKKLSIPLIAPMLRPLAPFLYRPSARFIVCCDRPTLIRIPGSISKPGLIAASLIFISPLPKRLML
jgi:hypothetical protein